MYVLVYVSYFIYTVTRLVATDCNQSLTSFQIFVELNQTDDNQPLNGATATKSLVAFGCVAFSFSFFSGLCK